MTPSPWTRSPRTAALLAALLLSLAPLPLAADEKGKAAEEKAVKDVPDAEAMDALERFAREFDTEDLDLRLEALKRLRRIVHPDIAARLLDLALRDGDLLVRADAFRGLTYQKTSARTTGPKVARWLSQAAEENRKQKARGNYGVRVDPRTGEVDTESPEGREALRQKRDRGRMLSEAVKFIRDIEYRDRDSVEVLTEFLSDGNDDLVALVLGAFGTWKEWTVLPELVDLFEIYPEPDSFETGSVTVDTGAAGSADQQAAKRKWMSKFGDPDRRRPRPKVHHALKQALKDITGEDFATPRDLREFMKRPDVKRKVRGR